jgi:zinc transporter 2
MFELVGIDANSPLNKDGKIPLKTKPNMGLKQEVNSESDIPHHRCAVEHQWFFISKNARARRAIRKLVCVTIVCFIFMMVEIVGGILSGSLAIITDAAHQLSDVAGFAISFIAIWMSTKKGNMTYTYGYHRADVIGACGSILIIWILLLWLCNEAVYRLRHIDEINIDARIMLITSILGLGCNILNWVTLEYCCNAKDEDDKPNELNFSIASHYTKFQILRNSFSRNSPKQGQGMRSVDLEGMGQTATPKEEAENLNVRAAVIHMLGDAVTSVGVIIAAVIIYINPEYKWADPCITFVFSVIVLFTTLPVMSDAMRVLLEGAPDEIDQIEVYNALNKVSTRPDSHILDDGRRRGP